MLRCCLVTITFSVGSYHQLSGAEYPFNCWSLSLVNIHKNWREHLPETFVDPKSMVSGLPPKLPDTPPGCPQGRTVYLATGGAGGQPINLTLVLGSADRRGTESINLHDFTHAKLCKIGGTKIFFVFFQQTREFFLNAHHVGIYWTSLAGDFKPFGILAWGDVHMGHGPSCFCPHFVLGSLMYTVLASYLRILVFNFRNFFSNLFLWAFAASSLILFPLPSFPKRFAEFFARVLQLRCPPDSDNDAKGSRLDLPSGFFHFPSSSQPGVTGVNPPDFWDFCSGSANQGYLNHPSRSRSLLLWGQRALSPSTKHRGTHLAWSPRVSAAEVGSFWPTIIGEVQDAISWGTLRSYHLVI